MSVMTQERLDELEAVEAAAISASEDAQSEAGEARMAMAEQALNAKGVIIGETPCTAPEWGFGPKITRVLVVRCTSKGKAVCAPITVKNAIHGGKNDFTCEADKIELEATP